ncbi:MAG: prolyl oligopeptidase family serine peptidase [Pirellulales bacterium]
MWLRFICLWGLLGVVLPCAAQTAATPAPPASAPPVRGGDALLADYLQRETKALAEPCLADVRDWTDWQARRPEYVRQLNEMLGLEPLPERTPLMAATTGTVERDGIVVEKIHFQSRPQLYVTANLYRPAQVAGRLPAILYVCGHGGVKKDGVSYGNKVTYQHHGAWFARHGYICLIIDSLQLGEIEATHHGTHRFGMWWWLSRGYTPAGVEAWNCIRALDYLQSRDDVDGERLGATGRSGGGAYSWWIAALDERIRAAVPVAGITDLHDHVVDHCVEGHCDCMYMVNTYRWDYPQVAALVAPRPLLIANTDRDGIFPLRGVVATYERTRRIYDLASKSPPLGLTIAPGPHKDTQDLQVPAFRWFDAHLQAKLRLIDEAATPRFQPEELRVLTELPQDERNTTIHESFVSAASPPLPQDAEHWRTLRDGWLDALQTKSFRAWPATAEPLEVKPAYDKTVDGVRMRAFDFTSQAPYGLRLYVAQRAELMQPDLVVLNVLDEPQWREFQATFVGDFSDLWQAGSAPQADAEAAAATKKMFAGFPWAMAYVAPRGVGPTAFDPSERKQTHIRRRFYLLGQTLESTQTWDVRRAIQALRTTELESTPLWLQSRGAMGGVALYASLFEPHIRRLDLHSLPASHRDGPTYLNVQRYLDLPQAVAMAAERSSVVLYQEDPNQGWQYARDAAARLSWDAKKLQFRALPKDGGR